MVHRTYSLPYIIILAGVIHLGFAYGFAAIPDQIRPFVVLGGGEFLTRLKIAPMTISAILTFATVSAYVALILEGREGIPRRPVLLLVFPQWILFFISIFMSLYDVATVHTAGFRVSRSLLIAVLPGIVGASILHTMSILERYFGVVWPWITRHDS